MNSTPALASSTSPRSESAHVYTAPSLIESSVEINGARINYREYGCGDTVVILLHCSASSGAQWRSLSERLGTDCRSVAVDLYGYGKSDDWSGDGPLTLADEAAAVLAVMSRYEGPVHLVGHSYGGAVALRVATQKPARIASLTLVEPVAFHLLKDGAAADADLFAEIKTVADAVNDSVICGNYRGGMGCFVNYWNGRGSWEGMKEEARRALAIRSRKVTLDFWSCTNEDTQLEAYASLPMSTMILWGEKTRAPTARLANLLAQTIPGARGAMVPEAGHMCPISHRDTVNELIVDQLARQTIAVSAGHC
jgi:pimeloyl-ACP methyl ester carboxylesterase